MTSTEKSQNPLQAGFQSLCGWFDSLPKPQIRLPGQTDKSNVTKARSASSDLTASKTAVSGTEHNTVSYRVQASPSALERNSENMGVGPVDKDDLGRATWTLLHVLAAQFPEQPSKSQQKDVRALVCLVLITNALQNMRKVGLECHVRVERSLFWLLVQVDVLTRIYPCADCAAHFKDIVRCAKYCALTCFSERTCSELVTKLHEICCVCLPTC